MELGQKDYHILQITYYLMAKYNYKLVNISHKGANIYLTNPAAKYSVIKVTKESVTNLLEDEEYKGKIHELVASVANTSANLLVLSVSDLTINQVGPNYRVNKIICGEKVDSGDVFIDSFDDLLVESKDLYKDINNLNRLIIKQTRLQKKSENRKWENQPKLSLVIGAICVVYFVLINILAGMVGSGVDAAIFLGAYYKMSVVAMHEYWRLFTAGFMHFDILHLLFNMIALYTLGRIMELIYTKKQYLIILISAIVVGNLFVLIGDPNTVVVGLSGGLYGFLGAYISYIFSHNGFKSKQVTSTILQILLINIMLSLLPGVSLMGHLGGFITGIILGIVFVKLPSWKSLVFNTKIAGTIGLVVLLGLATQVRRIYPIYNGTDNGIIEIAREFNLNAYADKMEIEFSKYYPEGN